MSTTEGDQTCCGMPVTEDGYCDHRGHHPRQVTPEMVEKAARAMAGSAWERISDRAKEHLFRADARAALEAVI